MMTAGPTVLDFGVAHACMRTSNVSALDRPGTNKSFASGIRATRLHMDSQLSHAADTLYVAVLPATLPASVLRRVTLT